MKNIQIAMMAALVIGSSVLPMAAQAAQVKHRRLKAAAAGIAAYEAAKHSHNKFAHKHRFAAGIAGAMTANHYMKKQGKPKHHH
jgi:hypothetical protein